MTAQSPCQPGDTSRCRAKGKCASWDGFPAWMERPAESLFPVPGGRVTNILLSCQPFFSFSLTLSPSLGQQTNSKENPEHSL